MPVKDKLPLENFEDKELSTFLKSYIDRIELCLQALVYESQGLGDLQEFFDYSKDKIKTPKLKEIFNEIIALRS